MNEHARHAALEAIRGPWRVQVDGADIRGFWAQVDAQDAADGFARKGRPASVLLDRALQKTITISNLEL